jgi:hypothetical protein
MTEVDIGMKLSRARKLAEEILATPDGGRLQITLYCQDNTAPNDEIVVNLSNEDMERDEIAAEEIYVDIEQD